MADRVGPEGSPTARLVLIGEAPGRWEHVYGRPFVGPSYTDKLLPWWTAVGLKRDDFYIDNVLDYQPGWIERVPEAEMREAFAALHSRLAALYDPIVIVPTGNYALYALTGKGRVAFHARDGKWERPGITDWRGSILEYQDARGRRIKVIPTIHPASCFRTPWYERLCRADWARIAADAEFRELRRAERHFIVMPRRSEVLEYIKWTRAEAAKHAAGQFGVDRLALSLDVETPKHVDYETRQKESASTTAKCGRCQHTRRWHEGDAACTRKAPKKAGATPCGCAAFVAPFGKPRKVKLREYPYLDCIGYSWDPKLAICVPTTETYWRDGEWPEIKAAMTALHADAHVDIGGQNFSFDMWWCATEGMPIGGGTVWDLMKMNRCRFPADRDHDLATQASLHTREPFWKHEAKDPDSVQRYAANREAFFRYNCTDSSVQRELLPLHLAGLAVAGRREFYDEMESPMDAPLMELTLTGIRADEAGRKVRVAELRTKAGEVGKAIEADAGIALVARTAVSTQKMRQWLYETLRLPVQYTRNAKKEKVVSTNVITIKRLMERFPGLAVLQTVGAKVLQHRKLVKDAGALGETKVAADGRVYSQFRQDTRLGRLKSAAPPNDVGDNLQNQDRKLRQFYLPDLV